MNHDIVIRGGSVVDGTGTNPFQADIAIDGDRITGMGRVSGSGHKEIDASGLVVTPGFVDAHTHLDAQIGWDSQLTSVTWHGVTTALLGNCGVTFAPCKPSDRDFLAGMMETVEDIPKKAILHGLPWSWESYGEYLDTLDGLKPAINLCGLAGHSATRLFVMGERAIEEQATEDEIRQISELAAQSVKEGAFGFSVNRNPMHKLPDGRAIPGTFADREELRAIARAIGPHGGLMQMVTLFREFDEDIALIEDYARLSKGAIYNGALELGWKRIDQRVRAMRDQGLNVTSITVPRGGGNVGGLFTNNLFKSRSWDALLALDNESRLKAIRDPETRQQLVDEIKNMDYVDLTKRWFWMGSEDRPRYSHALNESLYDMAQAAGEHPGETWLRLADESDGKAMFHMRGFNVDMDGVEQMIQSDWVIPTQGDAGAHVSKMNDSGCTSFVLSHWVRDKGVFTLPEAVRKMTSMPAEVLGLNDRGALAVGKKADVNVIDTENVAERQPEIVNDLPFGASRFIQRGRGYRATICNGEVILENDELTGDKGGRVLRSYER